MHNIDESDRRGSSNSSDSSDNSELKNSKCDKTQNFKSDQTPKIKL